MFDLWWKSQLIVWESMRFGVKISVFKQKNRCFGQNGKNLMFSGNALTFWSKKAGKFWLKSAGRGIFSENTSGYLLKDDFCSQDIVIWSKSAKHPVTNRNTPDLWSNMGFVTSCTVCELIPS